jgi:hypothetical protein
MWNTSIVAGHLSCYLHSISLVSVELIRTCSTPVRVLIQRTYMLLPEIIAVRTGRTPIEIRCSHFGRDGEPIRS